MHLTDQFVRAFSVDSDDRMRALGVDVGLEVLSTLCELCITSFKAFLEAHKGDRLVSGEIGPL